MRKVAIAMVKAGDVLAQFVQDEKGRVLLPAGAVISERSLQLLGKWNLEEVRLRDEGETDEEVMVALELERVTEALGGKTVFQEENIHTPSILRPEAGAAYSQALQSFTELWRDMKQTGQIPEQPLTEMAAFVVDYVRKIPEAIGYSIKEEEPRADCGWLSRHGLAVGVIAAKITKLAGYDLSAQKLAALAGLLHDIGKLSLGKNVAEYGRGLSEEEVAAYHGHVSAGYGRIKKVSWIPPEVMIMIAQHHEAIDGSGFPLGLGGGKIYPLAQIVTLANDFDRLVRKGDGDFLMVRSQLMLTAAPRLDSQVVEVFDRYLADFLYHLTMNLSDGRKAKIIYLHQGFHSPVVQTSDGEYIDLNRRREVKLQSAVL